VIKHVLKSKKQLPLAIPQGHVEAEKKKKILDAEEKRKLSAQRIATVEDSVQRLQKERQSRSKRPDIKTTRMATY
jgi:hypothetical protein